MTSGEDVSVIESAKAAGEVSSPLDGVVESVNETLVDAPETINADPLGAGWLVKFRVDGGVELSGFMDEASYQAFIADV